MLSPRVSVGVSVVTVAISPVVAMAVGGDGAAVRGQCDALYEGLISLRYTTELLEYEGYPGSDFLLRLDFPFVEMVGDVGARALTTGIQNVVHTFEDDQVVIPPPSPGLNLYWSSLLPGLLDGVQLDADPNVWPRFGRVFENVDGIGNIGNNVYNREILGVPSPGEPIRVEWAFDRVGVVTDPVGNFTKDLFGNWIPLVGTFALWDCDVTINGEHRHIATYYLPVGYCEFLRANNPVTIGQEHFEYEKGGLDRRRTMIRFADFRVFDGADWHPINNWVIVSRINNGLGDRDDRFGFFARGDSLYSVCGDEAYVEDASREPGTSFYLERNGDFDHDGDTDLDDYESFLPCFSGPSAGFESGCHGMDFDVDGDVDLFDASRFLSWFGGVHCYTDNVPGDCTVDCDGNEISDYCDIALFDAPDCNENGIPDSCEKLDGALAGIPEGFCSLAGTNSLYYEAFGDNRPTNTENPGPELAYTLRYNEITEMANGSVINRGGAHIDPNSFLPYVMKDVDRDFVILHPGAQGPDGPASMGASVTFVAPSTGEYHVSGDFARANDFRLAGDGVDVAVIVGFNSADPAFEGSISSSHVVDPDDVFTGDGVVHFDFAVMLEQEQALRFIVFSGPQGQDVGFDATALRSVIRRVDCNDNHIPDDCDIADGASLDDDHDGIPDECQ